MSHSTPSFVFTHGSAGRAFRPLTTLIWTLGVFVPACAEPADDAPAADTSSSEGAGVESSTEEAASATEPSDSSTSLDPTATDAGEDTLADGCWEYAGELAYEFDVGLGDPPFTPFGCAELPMPCAAVTLYFETEPDCEDAGLGLQPSTPEEQVATEEAARCVLTAMRDGTPASHAITLSFDGGVRQSSTRYTVLDAGVVTYTERIDDLSGSARERYLEARDAAWFDTCLAAPDLVGLVPCLWVPDGAFECSEAPLGPVDTDACLGEAPQCA